MSKAGAEWSDQQILAATRQKDENGRRQFEIMLPDNYPLTSEWMDPSQIKARTLISWCEAVRNTIGAREENKREEMMAKRARRKAEEQSTVPSVDSTQSSPANLTGKQASAIGTEDRTSDLKTSPTPSVPTQQPDGHQPPTSADDFVRVMYETSQAKLSDLQYQGKQILERIEKAKAEADKWKAIYELLGEDSE